MRRQRWQSRTGCIGVGGPSTLMPVHTCPPIRSSVHFHVPKRAEMVIAASMLCHDGPGAWCRDLDAAEPVVAQERGELVVLEAGEPGFAGCRSGVGHRSR